MYAIQAQRRNYTRLGVREVTDQGKLLEQVVSKLH